MCVCVRVRVRVRVHVRVTYLGGSIGNNKVDGVNGVDEGPGHIDGASTGVGHLFLCSEEKW